VSETEDVTQVAATPVEEEPAQQQAKERGAE